MTQKQNFKGIVFLKEEQIEKHIMDIELKDGRFICSIELANEQALKENCIKCVPDGVDAYEITWRFATKKERNAAVKKYGGVFQLI